ncbi:MAG TPA: methyltransferase domain-containing protein [Chitinophagaceae bacterium]
MDQQQLEIREQQKASWDKFSPGWKKWDDFTMNFLKPMGDEIISMLDIKPSDNVLDIATGTGEPGLTIASMVNNGKVTGTDLSPEMIKLAAENAKAKGLTNYTAVVADVCELPFADNTFDAISCRMGFMFFPDMLLAAKEMHRVLKPGGRMATSVWDGPEKNPWITAMMGTMKKYIEMPAPPPGAPGMFRCAAPGFISGLLKEPGFKNSKESKIESRVKYDNVQHYWTMMNEVAAPVVAAMSQADNDTKNRIKDDLVGLLNEKAEDGVISLPFSSIIIYGEK